VIASPVEDQPEPPLRLHEPDAAEPPKPTPVVADAGEFMPFAAPIALGKKSKTKGAGKASKAAKAQATGKPPAWASLYLDLAILIALAPALLAGAGAWGSSWA
jgi:fatty-acyl-CoA synthase